VAILRGSNYLIPTGQYGHLQNNLDKGSFLEIRKGFKKVETELRFEIAGLIDSSSDFNSILFAVHYVS
jgi:hypothetical protein